MDAYTKKDSSGPVALPATVCATVSRTHTLAFAVLLLLWVIVIAGYTADADWIWPTSSKAIFPRNLWLALLLAPVGAIARWKLSALNGTLRGRWSWFFLGTFTANMLA